MCVCVLFVILRKNIIVLLHNLAQIQRLHNRKLGFYETR